MKLTKKDYEEYLNEIGLSLSEDNFWFGGHNRYNYPDGFSKYGSLMRK